MGADGADLRALRVNLERLTAWIDYDIHDMASFVYPPNEHDCLPESRAAYEHLRRLERSLAERAPFGTVLTTPADIGRVQVMAVEAKRAVVRALGTEQ